MGDVASTSGYEPNEEDIKRQNLETFEYDPSNYEDSAAENSDFDLFPSARFNTEGPEFDQYIEKRTQELSEHFGKSQERPEESDSDLEQDSSLANKSTEDDKQQGMTEEDVGINASPEVANALGETTHQDKGKDPVNTRALTSLFAPESNSVEPSTPLEFQGLENQGNDFVTVVAEQQASSTTPKAEDVSALGLMRDGVLMDRAIDWEKRAKREQAKTQQQFDKVYNDALTFSSAPEAAVGDRLVFEKRLAKEGNNAIFDLVIALDSLSGPQNIPDWREAENIFKKTGKLAEENEIVATEKHTKRTALETSVGRQSSDNADPSWVKGLYETADYKAGDRILVSDAGGGTVDLVSYKVKQLEPLEKETASEASHSIVSDIVQADEDAGQPESSKGKAPAGLNEPPKAEPPTRKLTDPLTSYSPCDILSVARYKRMMFRTKQSGPMCYVQFDDTVCAMETLFLLQGHPLQSSVNGGIRLGFSRNPLGVRSEPSAAARDNSQVQAEMAHQAARGEAGRAVSDFSAREEFEASVRESMNEATKGAADLIKSAAI
ncbi:hypothetical protein DL98DRAFT_589522 [Cadophora sp. DSE1049]|nr:hypothetical protein DL98DRAFT_589522 [Cadophora sp. DSE1049]